jgi:hypothetical protein
MILEAHMAHPLHFSNRLIGVPGVKQQEGNWRAGFAEGSKCDI